MTDANELQRRMAQVRTHLAEDVEEIADSAGALSDWRYYVRSHPWICFGAAAAAGYLVVPRRLQVMSPDAKTLARLARQNRLVVAPRAQAGKPSGLFSGLLAVAGNVLIRSALAYAGQQFRRGVEQRAARDTESGPRDEAGADRPRHPR